MHFIIKHLKMFQKIKKDKPSKPHDLVTLERFPKGLSCRSALVPPGIGNLPEVKGRTSEYLVSYCWEACPTVPAIKEIKDSQGRVIEVVEVGKGYVSMRDGPPPLPPRVKRKAIYAEIGQRLKLECPK